MSFRTEISSKTKKHLDESLKTIKMISLKEESMTENQLSFFMDGVTRRRRLTVWLASCEIETSPPGIYYGIG
jgi:hypothetical protein